MKEAVGKMNELGRNSNNVFRHLRKMRKKVQMLLVDDACEEMMGHFILMYNI